MLKKYFGFILVVFFIMILSACNEKTTYSGESENWSMEIEETRVEDEIRTFNRLEYIGDGEPPKKFRVEVDYAMSKISTDKQYDQSSIEWNETICNDCANYPKDRELKAEISWEKNSENIQLTKGN